MSREIPPEESFVSVIVPTYQDSASLNVCLQALQNQTLSAKAFEVIVVNNDLSMELKLADSTGGNVRVLVESERGAYAARNAGVRQSSGAIIAFTDSDCIPHPDWLSEGVKAVRNGNPFVGGEIQLFSSEKAPNLAEKLQLAFSFRVKEDLARSGHVATANLFVERTCFERVGFFPEQAFSGGDREWARRAAKIGITPNLAHRALVFHPCRKDLVALFGQKKRIAGGVRQFRKMSERWEWLKGSLLGRLRYRRNEPLRKEGAEGEARLELAVLYGLHFLLGFWQLLWVAIYLFFPKVAARRI